MVDRKPPPGADIVNLRRARKARDAKAARDAADANRLQHGRTNVDRSLTDARNARAARDLDAKKREPGQPDQGDSDSES